MRAALLLAALALAGCGAALAAEARTADAVARAANAALPAVAEAYEAEGNRAIDTAADPDAALAGVVRRWAPVWVAWARLRSAQGRWADTIEARRAGRPVDTIGIAAELRDAWCDLAAVAPPRTLPAPPVACPGGPDARHE